VGLGDAAMASEHIPNGPVARQPRRRRRDIDPGSTDGASAAGFVRHQRSISIGHRDSGERLLKQRIGCYVEGGGGFILRRSQVKPSAGDRFKVRPGRQT